MNSKDNSEIKNKDNTQSTGENQLANPKATKNKLKFDGKIKSLELEIQQEKDKFLRLFAEFENYKKRTSKERIELFKTAGQDVLVSLLPVLDDFDRALGQLAKLEDQSMFSGISLINNKLRDTLVSKGLEPFEVNIGDSFNADFHEAVTQIPASSDEMKGKIVDVLEKGYKLGEKIIRYPKVIIGQ
ncbi:MAG: nucleotide exchange factor GrpE [Flavobacteriales bacterium CG_4_9_14_3_um_filter_40_17]|nr:MAG: nucleotide exchange factor GrpE [Flavobacteriales bacterium CG_4_9_14_3_um_filter_40_17]